MIGFLETHTKFKNKDDDFIIDMIILLIKYNNQTHNMFVDWEKFFAKVDSDYRKNNKYIYDDKVTTSISNLRSCLSTFSDCREHSYILCIIYTLFQLLEFETLIKTNELDFNQFLNKLVAKHMRIGINKVFINTNINGNLLRKRICGKRELIIPLEYKDADSQTFSDRDRDRTDTIILNSKIYKDLYGVIRQNKDCKTYNCIQLANEGDHVVCYLYNYDVNNTSLIIKDCLYSNLYGEHLPNYYTYWFNSHNIIINEIEYINNNDRFLYLINSLSGGIFIFYELQEFSCNTININTKKSLHFETDNGLWFNKSFSLFTNDPLSRLKKFNINISTLSIILNKYIEEIKKNYSLSNYIIVKDDDHFLFLTFEEMYNFYLNMFIYIEYDIKKK
jgi:hypothetical protein